MAHILGPDRSQMLVATALRRQLRNNLTQPTRTREASTAESANALTGLLRRSRSKPEADLSRSHSVEKLVRAPTDKFSLHGLEYQYRGLLITNCLRCDIKPLELGY